MSGYTNKTFANRDRKEIEQKEGCKTILFEVTFGKDPKQHDLDFGFVISEDTSLRRNVIFNIYNFFKLEELEQGKVGHILYGPLAEAYYKRADTTSKVRVTENETMLLRNMDYLQDLIRRDVSQAVILQMTGSFKEALDVYDRKVEYMRKINAPQSEINKFVLLRGDAYRLNEDYEEAEQ